MRLSARVFCNTALILSLTALSGCGLFSQADTRYDPAPLTDYAAKLGVSTLWSAPIGSGGGYEFAAHVVGDNVYAATPSGAVTSLALSSGAVRWRADLGKLAAGVGSDGQTTAVVATDGMVIALDARGVEKWRSQASSSVSIPPVVGQGVVVVRSTDYRIQAFDAASGEPRWNIQRPGPALALRTSIQMIIVENVVISGLPSGRLLVIDARTGTVRWEGSVSASQGASDLERINDVVGAPLAAGPVLCGASYQGRIVCFDVAQGGRALWEQKFSSATGMTGDAQQIYAANQRDVVYAFALSDGHEVWSQKALLNRRLSTPAVIQDAVAVGDYQGYIHFLSRRDGHLLGRLQVGGGPITSPLIATPQGVLVQTSDGKLLLIGVR
ncbi:outer membrane protein assembly factor BamB [Alcaligenaceae bacterium CGII-47]|nr:outer membrane protein assembly factor BamB [Alcaligenaceae bacterium CGII-47]